MSPKPTLVLFGILGQTPFAGVAWQTLQYLEGFRRLGCDVPANPADTRRNRSRRETPGRRESEPVIADLRDCLRQWLLMNSAVCNSDHSAAE